MQAVSEKTPEPGQVGRGMKKVFIQLRIAPDVKAKIVKALKKHPGETITSVMLRGADLVVAELNKAAEEQKEARKAEREAKRKAKG
jgi:hypothetical protein